MWDVGRVSPNAGAIIVAWSSRTVYDEGFHDAFGLDFPDSGTVNPSFRDQRWLGFPLRCLVR